MPSESVVILTIINRDSLPMIASVDLDLLGEVENSNGKFEHRQDPFVTIRLRGESNISGEYMSPLERSGPSLTLHLIGWDTHIYRIQR